MPCREHPSGAPPTPRHPLPAPSCPGDHPSLTLQPRSQRRCGASLPSPGGSHSLSRLVSRLTSHGRKTSARTRAHTHAHICTQTHSDAHVRTHTYRCTHMHSHAHICTQTHTSTHTQLCTHTCAHTGTQAHRSTHAFTLARASPKPVRGWGCPQHRGLPRAPHGPSRGHGLPSSGALVRSAVSCAWHGEAEAQGAQGSERSPPGVTSGQVHPSPPWQLGLRLPWQRRRAVSGSSPPLFAGRRPPVRPPPPPTSAVGAHAGARRWAVGSLLGSQCRPPAPTPAPQT